MLAPLAMLVTVIVHGEPPVAEDPFATANRVTAEATMYLHVHDPDSLRDLLADAAVGSVLVDLGRESEFRRLWDALAETAEGGERELFGLIFDRDLTIVARPDDDGLRWTLLARVDREAFREIDDRLRLQLAPGREGVLVRRLPELDLGFAYDGDYLAIEAAEGGRALKRTAWALRHPKRSLETTDGVVAGRELGSGQVGFIVRHDPPMGGWTAMVGRVSEGRLEIRTRSSFEASPFSSPLPAGGGDLAVAREMIDCGTLAVAQRRRRGGVGARFLEVLVMGDDAAAATMPELGERVITVIGAPPDDRADEPLPPPVLAGRGGLRLEPLRPAASLPATGVALELARPADEERVDRFMRSMVEGLHRLAKECDAPDQGGRILPDQPSFAGAGANPGDGVGRAAVGPLAERLFPHVPGAESLTLHWCTVDGGESDWWVISTSLRQIGEMRRSLSTLPAPDATDPTLTMVGVGRGDRIARTLRGVRPHLESLATPRDAPRIATSLENLAALAETMRAVDWEFRRTEANRLDARIILELVPHDAGPRRTTERR